MSYLTSAKKAETFAEYGKKATNTGSIEAQVALLTEKINHISEHLVTNKKDFGTHVFPPLLLLQMYKPASLPGDRS